MNVAVMGVGHVGLVTCATLAHLGHEVVGWDIDGRRIKQLQFGTVPFVEPGLPELLAEEVKSERLIFEESAEAALYHADVCFICVGTPEKPFSREANLQAVEQAARTAAKYLPMDAVVVDKSTVPAGTGKRIQRVWERCRSSLGGDNLASNPEFLREGTAVHDSLNPDRILVGTNSAIALSKLRELYQPLVDAGVPFISTNLETAELAKHACNAFLALKISYMNGVARICEKVGADVIDVAEVMGTDPRIGPHFLDAGIGWGGGCFPKDVKAFELLAKSVGYDFPLLEEIEKLNHEAQRAAVDATEDEVWNLTGKKIVILGLSFKPGTDDVRCSPALALAKAFMEEGAEVVGYDPVASQNAMAELTKLRAVSDPYEALQGADCAVVCTAWPEIREIDWGRASDVMREATVIDGRNFLDREQLLAAGFAYRGMGRAAKPTSVIA